MSRGAGAELGDSLSRCHIIWSGDRVRRHKQVLTGDWILTDQGMPDPVSHCRANMIVNMSFWFGSS